MLKLSYPVDQKKFIINHKFWVDETNNPEYKGFYTVFDNHHPGIDFDTPVGVNILSSFDGIVVRKEYHHGMGNVVSVRKGNVLALYAHLEVANVNLGQVLNTGELVGVSGNTGVATTRPHLHFELRDLAKVALKDSVFEPVFGKEVSQYQPNFTYVVNNTNTTKNFVDLSVRYFGLPSHASSIRDANPQLASVSFDTPLPQGERLIIPSP